MKKRICKIVSLLLLVAICLAPAASAATYASYYLETYSASIGSKSGTLTVSYTVTGTGVMDEIGALSVLILEKNGTSWTTVKTFSSTTTSGMITTDKGFYGKSLSYSGTSGKQYYAIITVWAALGGSGDSRQIATSTITA